MKPATQAVVVLLCTVGFFSIPVLGAAIETNADDGVQFVLGVTDNTLMAQQKKAAYAGTGMAEAEACCLRCGLEWDYTIDACAVESQAATHCVLGCGPSGKW